MVAALIAFICVFCAVFAPWVAPHNPFDLATLELSNARLPPAWMEGGSPQFWLGTEDQGRDILSALMYGARISLAVGVSSVVLSVLIGASRKRFIASIDARAKDAGKDRLGGSVAAALLAAEFLAWHTLPADLSRRP